MHKTHTTYYYMKDIYDASFDTILIYLYMCGILVSVNISE